MGCGSSTPQVSSAVRQTSERHASSQSMKKRLAERERDAETAEEEGTDAEHPNTSERAASAEPNSSATGSGGAPADTNKPPAARGSPEGSLQPGQTSTKGGSASGTPSAGAGTNTATGNSSAQTNSGPHIINGFPVYNFVDSNRCAVRSVISSKSKVESLCKFLDNVRRIRDSTGYFPNPEEPIERSDTHSFGSASRVNRFEGSMRDTQSPTNMNASTLVHGGMAPGNSAAELMGAVSSTPRADVATGDGPTPLGT